MISRKEAMQKVTDAIMNCEEKTDGELIRCQECRFAYMKSMAFYCPERTKPLNPRGHCERGERNGIK